MAGTIYARQEQKNGLPCRNREASIDCLPYEKSWNALFVTANLYAYRLTSAKVETLPIVETFKFAFRVNLL